MKTITDLVLRKLKIQEIIHFTTMGYLHPVYYRDPVSNNHINVNLDENGPVKKISIQNRVNGEEHTLVTITRPGALKRGMPDQTAYRKLVNRLNKKLTDMKIEDKEEAVEFSIFDSGQTIKWKYHLENMLEIDEICKNAYLRDGRLIKTFGNDGPTTDELEKRLQAQTPEPEIMDYEHTDSNIGESLVTTGTSNDLYRPSVHEATEVHAIIDSIPGKSEIVYSLPVPVNPTSTT